MQNQNSTYETQISTTQRLKAATKCSNHNTPEKKIIHIHKLVITIVSHCKWHIKGGPHTMCMIKVVIKERLNIFSNFCFCLKEQSLTLRMEYYFIHIAAAAGLAISNSTTPFFSTFLIVCSCILSISARICSHK